MEGMENSSATHSLGVNLTQNNITEPTSASDGDDMQMMDGHMIPDGSSIAMGMMQMVFYAGVDVTVLIKQWKVTTMGELFGTFVFWFLVALLYQGLKRFRRFLSKRHALLSTRAAGGFTKLSSPESDLLDRGRSSGNVSPETNIMGGEGRWSKMKQHLLQSLLQMLQTTLSFLLMLVFMTYNVWLALAIVLGDACGYLIFSTDVATPPAGESCCG